MITLRQVAAALVLASVCSTPQASELDVLKDQLSKSNLEAHVRELATRPPTTPGGARRPRIRNTDAERAVARTYLENQLTSYGYDVHQEAVTRGNGSVYGQNIVARRVGAVSDMVFVLGAHYDTVPTSPGADDNASGVAALLEIARVFSAYQFDVTVEFVLFDKEESGLVGSRQYVAKSIADGKHIMGAIIFDMIAYTRPTQYFTIPTSLPDRQVTPAPNVDVSKGTFIAVIANSADQPVDAAVSPWQWQSADAGPIRSTELAASFIAATRQLGTAAGGEPSLPSGTLVVKDKGADTRDARRSDHVPFWDQGIAAVHVSDTGEFRDNGAVYHQMGDDYDSIDFDFLTKVTQATLLTMLDFVELVEYSISDSVPLLDAAYYARGTANEIAVTSGIPNEEGAGTAYWATKRSSGDRAIFYVDAYYPNSYYRVTPFEAAPTGPALPLAWSPDSGSLVTGDRIVGIYDQVKTLVPYRPHRKTIAGKGSFTRLDSQNWYVDVVAGNIWALPVLPGADDDASRAPVAVTNFPSTVAGTIGWIYVSPDGKRLAFSHQKTDGTKAVYCVPDFTAIVQAPPNPSTQISSKAPTSFADPAIETLRESRQLTDWPFFLWYGSHVSYVESNATTGRDVMISDVDGRRPPHRIALPGDQGPAIPFHGGSRVLCAGTSSTAPGMAIATIRVSVPASGSDAIKINDGNGSSLQIDNGTSITYPPGAKQHVFLESSIQQVDLGRFPANVRATDAARTIGPYGTTFSQPVTITMRYTDSELLKASDSAPMIFGYVKDTNLYSRQVPVISHDPATNTVVFKVSYASRFVLGVPRSTD